MIKNHINRFKNINPIYLIDFSISEEYVFSELEKRPESEIEANINYLLKTSLYFGYKKLYSFLKRKTFELYQKTENEKYLNIIEKNRVLEQYADL